MKVLGISFGRKGKNCDIVVKQALMAAKAEGADVKFLNTMKMDISHCTGCGACSQLRDRGKQIRCMVKDDYQALEHEVLEADGIIVAAPVYSIAPTGQMKNFIDRFGAAHDLASATAEQEKRIAAGAEELLDERLFKKQYVAYISVGGASTENWTSLGLPNFPMFGMSVCMIPVGHVNAYDMGRRTSPVLDPPFMKRISALGTNVVKSMGKERDEIEWSGDEGVCPVCHNNIITISGTTDVECPICGIEGRLRVDGETVSVTFSKEQRERARGTMNGLWEHHYELKQMMDVIIPNLEKYKEELPKLLKPFDEFEDTY